LIVEALKNPDEAFLNSKRVLHVPKKANLVSDYYDRMRCGMRNQVYKSGL